MKSEIYDQALKILTTGLLPADLPNLWIFCKLLTSIAILCVISLCAGFYLGNPYFFTCLSASI